MNKILQLHLDNAKREKKVLNMVRNGSDATIYIYDIIDPWWGVSASRVMADIAAAGDAAVLHVRINSPGGDVFESRAIIEAIKRFAGKTIAHIDSLAASAATSISLACDEVEMSDGGFYMVHNASGVVWGDKSEMRKTADLLEKIEGVIAGEYAAETGQEVTQIIAWMDDEPGSPARKQSPLASSTAWRPPQKKHRIPGILPRLIRHQKRCWMPPSKPLRPQILQRRPRPRLPLLSHWPPRRPSPRRRATP